jgi:tetratricopeptide (TPR) repeat protein
MPNYRANIRLVIAAGLSIVFAQPAMGIGGGGGGSDSPSSTAPQYDPAVEYQKGVDAYQAKDFKSAITAFKRVTGVVPRQASAQYLLGASYMAVSDFKKAKKPLEQAIRYDAKLIEAQRDLGITYARLGDKAKATRQRDAITAMKSACTAPCAAAAQYDAALQAVEAALSGTPQALAPAHPIGSPASADAVYVAAVGLINEKRYEEAITELEGALWTTGPHPDLLTYLGFANRKLGRYDRAREWYEAALAVAPEHRGALEYYGELKLELGDVRGARRHLARLDALCGFGCQQADELRRWLREADRSAS